MKLLSWNAVFENRHRFGCKSKHRRLVEIVNRIGEARNNGRGRRAKFTSQGVHRTRPTNATSIFADEETPDEAKPASPPAISSSITCIIANSSSSSPHVKGRADWTSRRGAPRLLSSWLTFHILEEDQSMARQIGAVAQRRGG